MSPDLFSGPDKKSKMKQETLTSVQQRCPADVEGGSSSQLSLQHLHIPSEWSSLDSVEIDEDQPNDNRQRPIAFWQRLKGGRGVGKLDSGRKGSLQVSPDWGLLAQGSCR